MGSISQAPSSPRSPHTHTHFQVFKPPIPRSSSWKSRPLVSLLCAHFLWLGLLWSQVDSMKRENAMEIASSAPHSLTPYTLFRPQFFWSERRIPLGILGAFPAATAIAAALSFNLSMRLAWGQGKRREKGRGGGRISLTLSWRCPPFYSSDQEDRASWRFSFHAQCTVPGVTLPLRPGQETQGQKTKQEAHRQIVYTPVLIPFPKPPATISFSESSESSSIRSSVFSCIWGKDRWCLLYLTQNWNPKKFIFKNICPFAEKGKQIWSIYNTILKQ